MSIRPNVSGFDIQKFKEMFGSADIKIFDAIFGQYETNLVVVDDSKQYSVGKNEDAKLIKDALIEGGEKANILEENHPDILIGLIYSQKGVIFTDSSDWRYYHIEYFMNILGSLKSEIRKLMNYFVEGRRFFSDSAPNSEYPYAYLTHNEVKIILADMKENWSSYNDSEGFGKDFKTWLEQISESGKDLFFTQD